MPRKTKESMDEKKVIEKKSTTAKKNKDLSGGAKIAKDIISKVKEVTSKATSKTNNIKSESTKKTSNITRNNSTTKKSSSAKFPTDFSSDRLRPASSKKTYPRDSKSNITSDGSKNTFSKKSTTTKKSPIKPKYENAKTKTSVARTNKKSSSLDSKVTQTAIPMEVEYYDLPYKYNDTVVKVLYQNPTTLFVYWEISDDDINSYREKYGDNFFETTYPILKVYNDTMNYNFDITINDFANSWYFKINDSKCHYHVELGRRPKFRNDFKEDYIYITSSNTIESPNDRILFNTNEDNSVYFRNIKDNSQRKVELPKLIEKLNLNNQNFGFPLIKGLRDLYKQIYDVESLSEFEVLSNPSSGGNPSSGSLSSRFK